MKGHEAASESGEQSRDHDEQREPSDQEADFDDGDQSKSEQEQEPELEAIEEELTYYRDVKPILDEKCTQCHLEGGIGPYPFTTYDEVKPFASLISYDVARGIMPPWRAVGELGVFEGDRRLTTWQKLVIKSWVDQGAPEGDPDEEPERRTPPARGLERIDETLELPEEFTPGADPDTYRCFVFEWPHQQTKFITGIGVVPSAPDIVHHAVVYLVPPGSADGVRTQDADDEAPGYYCTSVPTGSWLTSYEPGGYGQQLPSGLGMTVEPGSVIVAQMHYNTLHGSGSDRSHLELTLEDEVERVGRTQLILNVGWLLGTMRIPAGQPDVVHRWQGRPTALWGSPAQDIYAVDLHMHTLATSGSIGIIRGADGSSESLLEIPDWAFEWQETYRFKEPVRLEPDDQLYVECHFDNTAEHQLVVDGQRLPPRDVYWGESTTDEMCLGNVLVTPALE